VKLGKNRINAYRLLSYELCGNTYGHHCYYLCDAAGQVIYTVRYCCSY